MSLLGVKRTSLRHAELPLAKGAFGHSEDSHGLHTSEALPLGPLRIRSKTRFILLIGCGLALLYIYQLAITGQRHGDESLSIFTASPYNCLRNSEHKNDRPDFATC